VVVEDYNLAVTVHFDTVEQRYHVVGDGVAEGDSLAAKAPAAVAPIQQDTTFQQEFQRTASGRETAAVGVPADIPGGWLSE